MSGRPAPGPPIGPLSLHLERAGFRVRAAATGEEALRAVRARRPDLVVLDLMLPEVDGLEVCRRLRADRATAGLPILMLTAKADAVDRVVGLEVGADDDVVKPFSPRELVARVRAVLRRAQRAELDRPLVVGRLTLDPARRLVRLGDTPLHLTPREYELLETLVEAGGRVLTREQLLDRAWGYARAEEVETRTVDVHVRRLRAKLGEEGWRVLTVKGAGYRFEVE